METDKVRSLKTQTEDMTSEAFDLLVFFFSSVFKGMVAVIPFNLLASKKQCNKEKGFISTLEPSIITSLLFLLIILFQNYFSEWGEIKLLQVALFAHSFAQMIRIKSLYLDEVQAFVHVFL